MPKANLESILTLINEIESQQLGAINLIPSENTMSTNAAAAMSLQMSQRYVFPGGEGTILYWPAMKSLSSLLDAVEQLVQAEFGCKYSSVRPLSGIHCMTVLLSTLKREGIETVYFVPAEFGGHGNSPRIARRFGLDVAYLPMDPDSFDIDLRKLAGQIGKQRGKVAIYIDQWVSLVTPSIQRLRSELGADCYIHHDTSHILGLIAAKAFPSPLSLGANSFGGSTHKTFPGPQKGVILWNDPQLCETIQEEVSTFVSHAHTGSIAALGVTLEQFRQYGSRYAQQVLLNARCLAREIKSCGIKVLGESIGFTTTHQVICDLGAHRDLLNLGARLRNHKISLNFLEPGILGSVQPVRFGLQELTLRGLREPEVRKLSHLLASIIDGTNSEDSTEKISDLLEKCKQNAFIA
jgi:glycine hydroxymethyltransferase